MDVERVERDWSWYTTEDGEIVQRNWMNVENGKIPWDEVTDEELGKASMRDGTGGWRHNPAGKTPRKMVPELTRRLKERYDDRLRQELLGAQQVFIDIMYDTAANPADRMKAAVRVEERLLGKVPDKVEVIAQVKPWEGLIEGVLTDVPDGD